MTRSQEIESSARCRAHAERLRKFAETVTTPDLRKTLLDAAADFDKLARQATSGTSHFRQLVHRLGPRRPRLPVRMTRAPRDAIHLFDWMTRSEVRIHPVQAIADSSRTWVS